MAISIAGGIATFDSHLRTFSAQVGSTTYGLSETEIQTVAQLEARIGFELTSDQRAALQTEFQAAVDAGMQNPRILTKFQFMSRFTIAEKRAIYGLENTVIDVRVWLEEFRMSGDVNLDLDATINGLNGLAAGGILTPQRVLEIRGLA